MLCRYTEEHSIGSLFFLSSSSRSLVSQQFWKGAKTIHLSVMFTAPCWSSLVKVGWQKQLDFGKSVLRSDC